MVTLVRSICVHYSHSLQYTLSEMYHTWNPGIVESFSWQEFESKVNLSAVLCWTERGHGHNFFLMMQTMPLLIFFAREPITEGWVQRMEQCIRGFPGAAIVSDANYCSDAWIVKADHWCYEEALFSETDGGCCASKLEILCRNPRGSTNHRFSWLNWLKTKWRWSQ